MTLYCSPNATLSGYYKLYTTVTTPVCSTSTLRGPSYTENSWEGAEPETQSAGRLSPVGTSLLREVTRSSQDLSLDLNSLGLPSRGSIQQNTHNPGGRLGTVSPHTTSMMEDVALKGTWVICQEASIPEGLSRTAIFNCTRFRVLIRKRVTAPHSQTLAQGPGMRAPVIVQSSPASREVHGSLQNWSFVFPGADLVRNTAPTSFPSSIVVVTIITTTTTILPNPPILNSAEGPKQGWPGRPQQSPG